MHSPIEFASGFVENPDVVGMFLDIILKSLVVFVAAGSAGLPIKHGPCRMRNGVAC